MIFILISIVLIVPYAVLLLYYRKAWEDIPPLSPETIPEEELPFVSTIISARNEEMKIADCLHSLTKQTYPREKLEAIVINDHSEDNTSTIISSFSSRFPFIKLIELGKYTGTASLNSYKKKAIETGISLAKGELILTTDADCIAPPNWIKTVASYYREHQSAMIASPVRLALPIEGNWMQKLFYIFQILDFAALQGVTGAALYRNFIICRMAPTWPIPKAFL